MILKNCQKLSCSHRCDPKRTSYTTDMLRLFWILLENCLIQEIEGKLVKQEQNCFYSMARRKLKCDIQRSLVYHRYIILHFKDFKLSSELFTSTTAKPAILLIILMMYLIETKTHLSSFVLNIRNAFIRYGIRVYSRSILVIFHKLMLEIHCSIETNI